MLMNLFIYSVILAFFLAKVEINIEGRHGWGENLPTWRIKNALTKLIYGNSPLTGYHFWIFSLILLTFHLPFFIGIPWNISTELQVLAVYVFFLIIEDFFWFILNPFYGIKKFNKQHISWHTKWFGFVPQSYVTGYISGIILLICSFYV